MIRLLFFLVVNEPVPAVYQFRDYYREWLLNYEPFRTEAIAIVRQVHEAIGM